MSPDTVTIRRATLNDLPDIVALLADDALGQHREDVNMPLNTAYVEAFEAIRADSNQLLAVAAVQSTLVGCLQLTFIPGLSRLAMWRGQIESVRVARDQRDAGVGRLMIQWAIEESRKRGCSLVQLTSDKSRAAALRFYESLGFSASHEGLKLSL